MWGRMRRGCFWSGLGGGGFEGVGVWNGTGSGIESEGIELSSGLCII